MTCIICAGQFFPQSWSSPAEDCDCGSNLSAAASRALTDLERMDAASHKRAWERKCEDCYDRKGEVVLGIHELDSWGVDSGGGGWLCDNCAGNRYDAQQEADFAAYHGASSPQTLREQSQRAEKQKRANRT